GIFQGGVNARLARAATGKIVIPGTLVAIVAILIQRRLGQRIFASAGIGAGFGAHFIFASLLAIAADGAREAPTQHVAFGADAVIKVLIDGGDADRRLLGRIFARGSGRVECAII